MQLTTDDHKAYLKAVQVVDFDADYAMLNKIFATDYAAPGRYSPPKCSGAIKNPIMGNPDPALVNTSFCRAPEPHHAHGHEAVHATNQRA